MKVARIPLAFMALALTFVACGPPAGEAPQREAAAPAEPPAPAAAPEMPPPPAEESASGPQTGGANTPSNPLPPVPAAAAAPIPAPNPAPDPPSDPAVGATLYATYCATCHGPRGAGDGPAAVALDPKPAHHNDGNYMNTLTNEHLFKVVKEGGVAIGKSPAMTPWGGILTDAQIRDVVAFVRSLADPPYEGPKP